MVEKSVLLEKVCGKIYIIIVEINLTNTNEWRLRK